MKYIKILLLVFKALINIVGDAWKKIGLIVKNKQLTKEQRTVYILKAVIKEIEEELDNIEKPTK